MKIITGGVTAAKGFRQHPQQPESNIREELIWRWFIVRNHVWQQELLRQISKAAPVKWDQEIVYHHPSAQVIICNSGIANACTGEEGFSYCRATAKAAAETLNVDENSVLACIYRCYRYAASNRKLADGVKAMAPKLQEHWKQEMMRRRQS